MSYYLYTLCCASTGRTIVVDVEADGNDVRQYRRTFASAIQYGRMLETCILQTDDCDDEQF